MEITGQQYINMTIIDTIHGISHENCNKQQASRIIGLSVRQIYNIERIRLKNKYVLPFEKVNHYLVYFKVIRHKRGEASE